MNLIRKNMWPATALPLSDAPAPIHRPRTISTNYQNIQAQPKFKVANEKLTKFSNQKAEIQTRLDQLQTNYAASLKLEHLDKSAADIGQAEQILSGEHVQSVPAQI